jgi:hypothetical protein
MSDCVYIFNVLLTMEKWMKKMTFDRMEVESVMKALPAIMEKYERVLARDVGNGMCIIKFHLLLHAVEDISRFGTLRNTNSAIGENTHKFNTKADARRTQRIQDLLDIQTAARSIAKLAVRMGVGEVARMVKPPGIKRNDVTNLVDSEGSMSDQKERLGSRLQVKWTIDEEDGSIDVELEPVYKKQKMESILQKWGTLLSYAGLKRVLKFMLSDLTRNGKNLHCQIQTFTEYRMDGGNRDMFRAHPYWKKQGWHDWCLASIISNNDELMKSFHLLVFFEITGLEDTTGCISTITDGCYAFAHGTIRHDLFGDRDSGVQTKYYGVEYHSFLDDNASFVVWDAKVTKQHQKGRQGLFDERTARTIVSIIPVSSIEKTLLGVHDPSSSVPHTYLFIEPRVVWEQRFMEYVLHDVLPQEEENSNKKKKRRQSAASTDTKRSSKKKG